MVFQTLAGRNILNDQVIEQYFQLIKERNRGHETLPKVEVLSLFLYKKLEVVGIEEGFNKTKTWIQEDLREKDIVLIPIHKNDHWTLICVDIEKKVIKLYDSIIGTRRTANAPRLMKKYMEKYFQAKGEEVLFKIKICEDAPLQQNGVDCGVFAAQNAEKLARAAFVNTKQCDMPDARRRMMVELFTGKIIQEKETDVMQLKELQKMHTTSITKGTLQKKEKRRSKKEKNEPVSLRNETAEHSVGKLIKTDKSGNRKEKIKWPKSNSKEWS